MPCYEESITGREVRGSKQSVGSLQFLQADEGPQAVNDVSCAAYGPPVYVLELPICKAVDISMTLSQMFIFLYESEGWVMDYSVLQSNVACSFF